MYKSLKENESMNKIITIKQNKITFKLTEETKTATIDKVYAKGDIFIPESIKYKDKEFIVTNDFSFISGKSIRSVQFSPNSQLQIRNLVF